MDPEMKRELHAALVAEGNTMKDWFIAQAEGFLRERKEPGLPGFPGTSRLLRAAEDEAPYGAKPAGSKTPSPSNDE